MLLRLLLALLLSVPFAASALLQDAPRPALSVPSAAASDFASAPHEPSSYPQGTRTRRTLTVTLTRPDTGCATVRRAALWANGNLVHEFAPGPAQSTYSYLWTVPTEGIYQLSFSADLDNGRSVATTPIRIAVTNQGIDVGDVQVSWLHPDASGSAIAATNALGQTLWSRGYEPFGELSSTSGSVTDSRGLYSGTRQFFHGKALDDESGLTYFGARYYDPLLGRFTGFDPAPWNEANLHSFNRYAFANNNPLRFTDPDGRQAECEVACRRFEQPGIKSAVSVQEQADQMGATMAASAKSAASEVGQFVLIGAVTEGLGHLPRLFNFLKGMGGGVKAGEAAKGGATNIAAHETYKDELRAAMSKPAVSDPTLAKLIDPLYRPNATAGSGSTAAAIRQELGTGQPVGGAFHSQKAAEGTRSLGRWLSNNPAARQGDRAAAENVIRDMGNALGGR